VIGATEKAGAAGNRRESCSGPAPSRSANAEHESRLGSVPSTRRALGRQGVSAASGPDLQPGDSEPRVIGATNKDLRKEMSERQFREDLYYRLSMVEIHVPSLAERLEDLPLLTHYFVNRFAQQYGKKVQNLTRRANIVLGRHSWRGNVRELENVIGHACMMVMGETIDVADLPDNLRRLSEIDRSQPTGSASTKPEPHPDETTAASFEDHEKQLLSDALNGAGGNQSEAARHLRIGRDALRYKMKKHGLL